LFLPHLIGGLWTMKEGWGDLTGTEILPVAERVATRERFSTSHIARTPWKLLETELTTEDNKIYDQKLPQGGSGQDIHGS